MLQIVYLADHAEVISSLAEWFQSEWSDYYTQRSLVDIAQDFHADLNRNNLPIRLIACLDGELVGTIVLRELALETQPNYGPGLGGLYVAIARRKFGIGTDLVRAGMTLAQGLGYQTVYTTTNTAGGILEQLRWERMGSVLHHGEQIALYRCALNEMLE